MVLPDEYATNINAPRLFRLKLMLVMQELHELFELSKEHDLGRVSEDGVTRYLEEDGKTGFQVTSQFARPSEFLESLLDIIRVNFDPCAPGTFFLDANMGLLRCHAILASYNKYESR